MRLQRLTLISLVGVLAFTVGCGCNSRQQTYAPAPPIGNMPVNSAPPMGGSGIPAGGAMPAQANQNGAYHWRDVPANENVPVVRATFDQGGYQIYAQSGEIIVVPFENQNLHVLKFGRSQSGMMSFVNENNASPTLYVPNGGYLENASAAGAKWYPLPNDFNYTRPVYVSIAPSWNDWTGMGWYPGMTMYGGMWGYRPGVSFAWMPSFYVNIGGSRYNGWGGYRSYYNSNPGYVRNSVVYRNYNTARPIGRSSGFGTGRSTTRSSSGFSSGGSFGRRTGSSGFGSSRPSAGSSSSSGFGSGRSFGGSGGSFGTSRPLSGFGSSGSGFSSGRSSSTFGNSGSSFGSSRPSFGSSSGSSSFGRSSSGSFSGQRSTGSSFGSGRTSSGSFSGSGRSSGSSFGGSSSSSGSFRSSGSSFGSGRSSFGGSSSSGRSSFGGSSGRRR